MLEGVVTKIHNLERENKRLRDLIEQSETGLKYLHCKSLCLFPLSDKEREMQQKLAILVLEHLNILASLSQYFYTGTSDHTTAADITTTSSAHKQAVSPDYHMSLVAGHMDVHQSITPSEDLNHINEIRTHNITEVATTQIDCIAMSNSHMTNHMTTNKDPNNERLTFSVADLLEPSSNRDNGAEDRQSSLYDIADIGSHQPWSDTCHGTSHVTSHDIEDLLWNRKSNHQSCYQGTPTQLKSSVAQPVWRPYNDSTHLSLNSSPSNQQNASQPTSSFLVGQILENT